MRRGLGWVKGLGKYIERRIFILFRDFDDGSNRFRFGTVSSWYLSQSASFGLDTGYGFDSFDSGTETIPTGSTVAGRRRRLSA